ncbi:MAG: amidohydrolase family protein [Proteobacteria bacterium]|nr:amidohydrolase family protein [Pseudomonadota bacterium]
MTSISADTFRATTYALEPDIILGPSGELSGQILVVQDGYVAAVAPRTALPHEFQRVAIRAMPGCAIIPGFIDAHHHIIEPFAKAMTFGEPAQIWKRIWLPLEATATEETCYLGAKWTFLEALRGGMTTIVEHSVRPVACAEAVHRAADEVGIRLVSSTGGYDLRNFSTAAAVPDASASIDEVLRAAETHVANCRRWCRVVPSLACGNVQSNSGEMISAVSRFCRDNGILFQIHANEHTPEVHSCIETHKMRPIEYLHSLGALGPMTLIAHATLATADEIRLLKETDTAVSYNPVASMWKGNAVAPVLDYIGQGVRFGLGTDCTRNDAFRLLDAAEACQRLAFGLPRDDFSCGAGWRWVDAGTRGGAGAIGLGNTIGEIAPGRRADFLVLDRSGPEVSPSWDFTWELVRFYDRSDILATVVDGVPVVIDGKAVNFDSDSFVKEFRFAGAQRVLDSGLVRLHGSSETLRSSKQ